ncbi:hypothetical protein C8Q72DRAFT_795176 [Fomitopsis betulina]|nr:hypothetical protein C8Q72DRAFT_795176 [Fomitopsis betulina]
MPNITRVRPRDGTDSGGGLSTSTIIIIVVVCGSVFLLALVLFLWRFLARIVHRKKATPLPPVQLLAHQRELHSASVLERKTFYGNDTDSLLGLTNGLAATPSDGSLTPGGSFYASRPNSSNPEYPMSSETIFALGHPLSVATFAPLPNVNILGTGSSDAENLTPSPSTALSDASSEYSHVTSASGHQTTKTPIRPRPRSQARPRPTSMTSSIATMQTFQSTQSRRSVIRGAPHSRYSNIHIVLPEPLAPESYPFDQLAMGPGSRSSFLFNGQDDASNRGSTASDQWAQGNTRSMSLGNVPLSGLVGPAPNSSGYTRASRNQLPPPPVPQIPAEFAGMSKTAEASPSRSHLEFAVPLYAYPMRDTSRGRTSQTVTARQESPDTQESPLSEPRKQASRSRSRSRRNTLRKPRRDAVDRP